MLWAKAFHLFFIVCWFAGIFYLPRLFVYHAQAHDAPSIQRFKIMERKLYYGIATPSAILAIIFGLWTLSFNVQGYMLMLWFHIKLSLVVLLIAYHVYLGILLNGFLTDRNKHGHVFYRIINEIPVFFLLAIVILAIVKPFGMIGS